MSVVISVIYGDKAYYSSVSQMNGYRIGESADNDLVIPDLGYELTVSPNGREYSVEIAEKRGKRCMQAALDESAAIDYDRKIALFISESDGKTSSVEIPADCVIHVGRTAKEFTDGTKNEIVLDYPFVSRKHFSIIRSDGKTRVLDTGSVNGLFLNGERVLDAELHDGDVLSIFTVRISLRNDRLVFENVDGHLLLHEIKKIEKRNAAKLNPTASSAYRFSRAPRLVSGIERETINLERPPQAGGKPQINLLSVLVTPFVSVGLMLVLVFAMGMSAVMLIMSGVMSVVSAIIAIITYNKQKKQHGKTDEKIEEKYRAYLSDISNRLNEAHTHQLNSLLALNPSPQECSSIVNSRSPRLWERRPSDPDFLYARLGIGTVSAAVSASFQQSQVVIEENKLESEASELADSSKTISHSPILCSFGEKKQTGILGPRQDALLLTRNILTELATTHAYDELKIAVFVPEQEKTEWGWLRWLPHCADNARSKRFLFTSLDDAAETLSEIEEELSRRMGNENDYRTLGRAEMLPHYLFVIAAPIGLEKHPFRKYLFSDTELGCSSLFVYDNLRSLPKECSQIIEVNSGRGQLFDRTNSSEKKLFQIDSFSLDEADIFARNMAPLYMEAEQASGSIPTCVSFLEGYHVTKPDELGIPKRWARAKPYKTLSVPIAAIAGGYAFEFDIHNMCHGSHGIIAGMTRSGKTEMVQSWLLSLAVNYSPTDVAFVLIDWKGTGMISAFRELPHLAGAISNLDVRKGSVERNLVSLVSEVERRERIIDRYSNKGIKNINDLNNAYANGLVPEKLAYLMLVIDEFAEFKKTFPDFGKEIDSLMMTGSALGISVILMAQKPAGVVSAQSEANTKFRWCLRVASYQDSREMIGRPDAARINTPGRAFIKVGEDDVFEEVQSFWSGAPYDPAKGSRETEQVPINLVKWDGRRVACELADKRKSTTTQESEINVVVRYIADYCRQNNIPDAEKVWAGRLPERLAITDVLTSGFNGKSWPVTEKTLPVVGLIDDPFNQRQYSMELDFAKLGHTIIYGAPVTGKTTLLQTLILSLAMTRRPDEVSLYVMDFGGWNMAVLRELPHLGGIANDNEPERIKKLVLLLSDILQERKEKFSKAGVSNITAFRDFSGETLPDIFLIVDNFSSLTKMYPDIETFFISLTNSGANYGVYLVATATATNTVPTKISQNIKNVLALQLIDKSDYTYTVGKVKGELPAIIGRGYAKGNPPLEFQTALPAPGADDREVSDNIRKLATVMRDVWCGDLPVMIPEMPDTIPYGSIRSNGIVVGLSTDKVKPICFDYVRQHYLLISGTEQSGKSSMLQVIARQMKEKLGGVLYVFNIKGDLLPGLEGCADRTLTDAQAIDTFVEGLRPELQRRFAEKKRDPAASFEPIILAVDDFVPFYKVISNSTAERLLAVAKIGKGLDLYLIVAGDALELSGFFNKGEPLTLTLGKAKEAVMLGGCLNDHGAIPTKAAYSQKIVPVRDYEGMFIKELNHTVFRPMESKGGRI